MAEQGRGSAGPISHYNHAPGQAGVTAPSLVKPSPAPAPQPAPSPSPGDAK